MKKSELRQIIKEEIQKLLKEDWQVNASHAIDKISQAREIKELLKLFIMDPTKYHKVIKKEEPEIKNIVKSYIDMMKLRNAIKFYK